MSWKLEDRIVDRLDEAISEAERFLARAKLAQNALKAGGEEFGGGEGMNLSTVLRCPYCHKRVWIRRAVRRGDCVYQRA